MEFPSDKELSQLQMDAKQRELMRGGRTFLVFCRGSLVVFLVVGIIAMSWTIFFHGKLYLIVFLALWNLCVLSMIRLVSTQLGESQH
jgi:hypothetical protein